MASIRGIIALGFATLAGGGTGISSAIAQDAAGWRIAITPRVQFLAITNSGGGEDEFRAPFYGATIEVGPPGWQRVDFLVTAMNGHDTTKSNDGGSPSKGDVKRFDFEALMRYRLEEAPFNVFGGFRYVRVRSKDTNLDGQIKQETGTPTNQDRLNFYLAEIGAGFSANIDKSGQHVAFANATLGLGMRDRNRPNLLPQFRSENGTDFAATADVNAGYSFNFSQCCSISARYRAFIIPDGPRGNIFAVTTVAHGPEIGFTFRFGM